MKEGSYLKSVRAQYEDYPYPERNPEAEKGLVYSSKSNSLDCLNYYCFEGKRDLSKNFRVLVPGGGTGDCTTYIAEQLRDTDAEIVYLDMSATSMKIAQERAKVRHLDNITWVHDSILNIPNLNLGKFDYITCTGVLHHLEDPQAGLDALKSVLAEDGSMYLMVYASYGRTGVYQMQDMLRRLNSGFESVEDKIENTKKILKSLPKTNWFNFNIQSLGSDLNNDIGIYDLLLHPQDRSYTVPELYEYIEASGLTIHKLYNPDHPFGGLLFQPETFIQDPELLKVVKTYPFREQAAICESIFGQLLKQSCYVSFKDKSVPTVDDLELIPSLSVSGSRNYEHLLSNVLGNEVSVRLNDIVVVQRTPHMAGIFMSIDGMRTTKEVIEEVIRFTKTNAGFEVVFREFKNLFELLVKIDLMYLRAGNVPKYANIQELESRMYEYYGKDECQRVKKQLYS